MIVLRTNTKTGLNGQRPLQRLEREIDGTETCASGCEAVVNVRGFRFALECSFEHLLRGHILAAVQFDHAPIVKRVSVTGQHALRSQPGFRDCQVRACAGGYFRNLRILVDENPKLVTSFSKASSDELLMRTLERAQGGRLIDRWLPWRRRR